MDVSELVKILKKLEEKRDFSRNYFVASNLVEQFWLVQINIFTSVYFTTIAEIAFRPKDLNELYQAYARSRQTSTRYLIELFLTFVHVLALPQENRFAEIYSFGLSERINTHKIDFELDNILKNKDSQEKLTKNSLSYLDFITTYGKLTSSVPDKLDDFLKKETSSEKVSEIGKRFSFHYFKHNKLDNYTQEIENNILITPELRMALLVSYPLLSAEVHPTLVSLEDFEIFIMKDKAAKYEHLRTRNEYLESILKHLGEQMIVLINQVLV